MRQKLNVRDMTVCALFTTLTAVGAFIKIPVPVVPFTLQFLFTTMAGLLLGKRPFLQRGEALGICSGPASAI